ncbi:MAG: M1 family peptidase [Crocinitomicaceae bacterium TMED114]|nr:MAG: M1 family peptidase [Crocinitomicaceae bacterium TMED114]
MNSNFLSGRWSTGLLGMCALLASCAGPSSSEDAASNAKAQRVLAMNQVTDHHSYSRPAEARITHLNWDATVDFNTRTITGTATYDIETADDAQRIVFDTHDLTVHTVTVDGAEASFTLGDAQPFIGSALTVPLSEDAKQVAIHYTSSPDANALLWVEAQEDQAPFLFTQSQAILARTWIPVQDSPGVRFSYDATVNVPKGLMALMSAENPTEVTPEGRYTFRMAQPIPAYLLALAVGEVEFRSVGDRCAVYATPDLIDRAAYEFAEMEDLLLAAEGLYGPYAWERYDLLILPAAFPFGGMENPRLTFATPTIIAGDRSLVSLVAHELAHSWSGNLVTNATWDDFWLNEGFTVYFEQRIMEAVYGRDVSEMLATLSYQGLVDEVDAISDLNPDDTHLKLHLQGRDPDDGMTAIAYDKGYFFLRLLENTVGRERFDAWLSNYFETYAFKGMDTERFVTYLKETLLADEADLAAARLDEWIYGPGLPDNCPQVASARIERVDATLAGWESGDIATADLPWNEWVYQERYRFLSNLADDTPAERMSDLDATWSIGSTGNNEVLFAWMEQSVRSHYTPTYPRLESFLIEVGRRKFLTPLYRAMKETDQMDMALDIYGKARSGYHSVATGTMDELLGWAEGNS